MEKWIMQIFRINTSAMIADALGMTENISAHTERGKAMSRYIDAEKLMTQIPYEEVIARTLVYHAPFIDIVRCKECRHWRNEHICMAWSRYGTIETKADQFCSYGERRSDDNSIMDYSGGRNDKDD